MSGSFQMRAIITLARTSLGSLGNTTVIFNRTWKLNEQQLIHLDALIDITYKAELASRLTKNNVATVL